MYITNSKPFHIYIQNALTYIMYKPKTILQLDSDTK